MFERLKNVKSFFNSLFGISAKESDDDSTMSDSPDNNKDDDSSERKQVEDKKIIFREYLKKYYKPSIFNFELISKDVGRRTDDLKRDYAEHLNRQDSFTFYNTVIPRNITVSRNQFKREDVGKVCSIMNMYRSRKNSVVCSEWDKLESYQLDLFLRTHKVLDRKNILAAKELLEEIGRHLSTPVSIAEKSALKIAGDRIAKLEKERKIQLEKIQKRKFKDNFRKSKS